MASFHGLLFAGNEARIGRLIGEEMIRYVTWPLGTNRPSCGLGWSVISVEYMNLGQMSPGTPPPLEND